MIGKSLRRNGAFGSIISRLSLLAPTVHRWFAAKISVGYDLYGGVLESIRTTKLNSYVELGILWIWAERGQPRVPGHESRHRVCQLCWYFASPSEIVLYDIKVK